MPEGKSLTVWCNYQFPRAGALGGPLRGPPNTPSRSQGTEPVLWNYLKDIDKFEKNNPTISVNVAGYAERDP